MTVTFYGSGMVVESYNAMGTVKEALIYSHGRAGVFALAGQGARSVVGLLPMSEEQRRPVGAKARPRWGFAHKGTSAVSPGLAVEWLRRGAGRLASAPLWTETRSARIDQGFLKAALESAMRCMAGELGPKGIRDHGLSPGPLETRAASGISDFQDMMRLAIEKSPNRAFATIEDAGAYAAFLASDLAKSVNGTIP